LLWREPRPYGTPSNTFTGGCSPLSSYKFPFGSVQKALGAYS
jgi:hypothetical protein